MLLQLEAILRLIFFPFCLLSLESGRLVATIEVLKSGYVGAPRDTKLSSTQLVCSCLDCHCLIQTQQEICSENGKTGWLFDFCALFGLVFLTEWFDFCSAL